MLLVLVLMWYLQDLLQVLFSSSYPAPEFFLLYLLSCGLMDDEESQFYIWAGFVGGLLFDLRWSGVPGLCASLFSASLMVCRFLWFEIPREGRVPYLFLTIVSLDLFIVSIARALLSGFGKNVALSAVVVQLLGTVPLVLLAWFVYGWVRRSRDV